MAGATGTSRLISAMQAVKAAGKSHVAFMFRIIEAPFANANVRWTRPALGSKNVRYSGHSQVVFAIADGINRDLRLMLLKA